MTEEQVFCLKRTDIEDLYSGTLPQGGFTGIELEQLLGLDHFFLPRSRAEEDPTYKQLIPYQLIRHAKTFFVYQRGGGVGEGRLAGRLSLGIGGHINNMDSTDKRLSPQNYHAALLREQQEELTGMNRVDIRFLGWINDDSDPVGRVHLGAVHLCEVPDPTAVSIRGEGEDIHALGWWTPEEIRTRHSDFEKWSLLALELAEFR